jgi:hypothetical protein
MRSGPWQKTAAASIKLRSKNSCEIVRDEPAQPMEIKIVNASEIGKVDKIMTVKRDSDGKLSGAVLQPVT